MKKLVALIAVLAITFVLSPNLIHDSSKDTGTMVLGEKTAVAEDTPKNTQLNPEVLAAEFMNRLKQKTDENYKVLRFKNKSGLIHYISEVSSPKVAAYYVNGLYEEKDGALYVIPTELPPWFEEGKPFETVKINENSYHIVQKNSSDLYGSYEITLGAEKKKDKWIITFVHVK
ncbi:hypothetical protein ACFFJY_05760 [Fictibacillus aquaticus]|uniref:DUF3993 domain-containing protein n=1 Tax=Fictibacillus aquaticus TaxID=2021314 RepID=A0A235FAB7_9BACL|nr:hypothetical protein [Fictibacillus aquaticus]OYD58291.1 hypothetical protein CGZ90_10455 [Fictibacillus aquaticus]